MSIREGGRIAVEVAGKFKACRCFVWYGTSDPDNERPINMAENYIPLRRQRYWIQFNIYKSNQIKLKWSNCIILYINFISFTCHSISILISASVKYCSTFNLMFLMFAKQKSVSSELKLHHKSCHSHSTSFVNLFTRPSGHFSTSPGADLPRCARAIYSVLFYNLSIFTKIFWGAELFSAGIIDAAMLRRVLMTFLHIKIICHFN